MTTWLRVQAVSWTPVLLAAAWLGAAGVAGWLPFVAAYVLLSHVALVAILRAGRTPADVATIARALGVVELLWLDPFASPWRTWTLAACVAAFDLVDGWLARRFGGSDGGAVLDMETDQSTVLALALLVVAGGGAPHVLLLPLMRYAFVLAAWWWAIPAHDPKPVDGDNGRGRLVCAAVVVGLLAALLPCAAAWLREAATGVAVLLLLWSFGSDWSFLIARRRAQRVAG